VIKEENRKLIEKLKIWVYHYKVNKKMLVQTRPSIEGVGGKEVVFIIIGMGIIFLILFFWKIWNKVMKARERPNVFFIDLSTHRVRYMGQFVERMDFDLEVEKGNRKSFWGIKTSTNNDFLYIVPSFGSWEDMVMWDQDNLKGFIFILGILIGTGQEGIDIHQQWMNDAFPSDIYDFDQPTAIPNQFVLCKPLWNRNMEKAAFHQNVMSIHNVFTLFHKMIVIQDQQLNLVSDRFGNLLITRLTSATDHLLSQWEYILDAWNTMHQERTVPLFVLSQLLHISPSRVSYAGLSSALNQGGIQAAVPFLANIKETIGQVAEQVDLITLDKGNTEMLFQKVNQNREELLNLARQNAEYEQNMQQLIQQNNMLKMAASANQGMNQNSQNQSIQM